MRSGSWVAGLGLNLTPGPSSGINSWATSCGVNRSRGCRWGLCFWARRFWISTSLYGWRSHPSAGPLGSRVARSVASRSHGRAAGRCRALFPEPCCPGFRWGMASWGPWTPPPRAVCSRGFVGGRGSEAGGPLHPYSPTWAQFQLSAL